MAYPTKIATCCYCGTRATLVLEGKGRHELSCSACGAPLHDLKMLRKDRAGPRELVPPSRLRDRHAPAKPARTAPEMRQPRKKKPKYRKGFMRKVFEEAFDVIEDIFD